MVNKCMHQPALMDLIETGHRGWLPSHKAVKCSCTHDSRFSYTCAVHGLVAKNCRPKFSAMFPWLGPPCLFLFFLIISTMPALLLAAACEPERCGNVSVSAPFGIVSGSEEKRCAQMGFQVHCTDDVPYLGYYEREYRLQILNIFYNNGSLLVSDVHKIRGFNLSDKEGCRVPTANTATKVGHPFSMSPLNQNLVFYNCTKVPGGQAGLVETVCGNNTFVRAGGRYNWTGGINSGYTLEGCSATAVPVLGASQEVNARDYEALISDGFLLTWQSPSGGSGKLTHPRHSSNVSRQQLGAGQ